MHFTLRQHTQDFLMHCRHKGHSKGTLAAWLKQKRHEHLTRRYERLERRTDDIRDTAWNRKLLAEYG